MLPRNPDLETVGAHRVTPPGSTRFSGRHAGCHDGGAEDVMHSIGTALLLVVAFAFTGCAAASEDGDREVDALGLECFPEELPSDPCGACGDDGVCLELRPSIVTPDG